MDDYKAWQCRSFSTLFVRVLFVRVLLVRVLLVRALPVQMVAAWLTGLLVLSGVVLSGCTPVAPAVPPAAAPPQVPQEMNDTVLDVAPAELALTRADLVAGFQLASEQSAEGEYAALYLRRAALAPETSGENKLLSVLTSVGVYTTTADAANAYRAASASAAEQSIDEIALGSEAATDIVIEEFPAAAEGANASEAYRVSYKLMGQSIFQYGHRFQIGNVVAYLIVGGIGNPDEPEHLLEDARDLVQRQIDKIAEASMQPVSE